jgi:uncharacterized membrane protein YcaP (DUF421 family)
MKLLSRVDWGQVFVPQTSLLEIVVRGTIAYLAIFLLLRLSLKRESGTMAITNLLVMVLIADAAQNGMAGNYHSITEGLLLVSVIIFWSWVLDWTGYRFPWVQRLVHPERLLLVRNGRMLAHNMREELITEEELMSQLRLQGIDDLAEVREASVESDGRISVVRRRGEHARSPDRRAT